MAAMTRRESEERQQAVLRFFMEHPTATGDEAQKALISGRLTGKKGPPMGIGMLFRVKRQAESLARSGAPLPPAPAPAPEVFRAPAVPAHVGGNNDELEMLRERVRELQRLLANAPGGVVEIHITRDGARMVRLRPSEEEL
jgi:hypothetical protein